MGAINSSSSSSSSSSVQAGRQRQLLNSTAVAAAVCAVAAIHGLLRAALHDVSLHWSSVNGAVLVSETLQLYSTYSSTHMRIVVCTNSELAVHRQHDAEVSGIHDGHELCGVQVSKIVHVLKSASCALCSVAGNESLQSPVCVEHTHKYSNAQQCTAPWRQDL
jgi:hypothetical protein